MWIITPTASTSILSGFMTVEISRLLIKAIQGLSIEQLDILAEDLLYFTQVSNLESWLNKH